MKVLIDCVNQLRHVVAANVTTDKGTHHRLGHLPTMGWFCCCARGKQCAQIKHVQNLVPKMEPR